MYYDEHLDIRFDVGDVKSPSPQLRRLMAQAAEALRQRRMDARSAHEIDPSTQPCLCYEGRGALAGKCVCMRTGMRVRGDGTPVASTIECTMEDAEREAERSDAAHPVTAARAARDRWARTAASTTPSPPHTPSTRRDAVPSYTSPVARARAERDAQAANAWRTRR